ncbi:urease accessory protein UreH [Niallia sp.]|uniref:urease accessory protein UreH n=1 Tax=Niallia sp. TaxID=2837523 RepID=UPI002899869E|nr:urease accessory protein UreH [Niallia sp.]
MEFGFLSILLFGLVLGFKHALEPDHVIAVSTIASRSKNLWNSSLSGVFWGIGHTFTLLIFGLIVIVLKQEIPDPVAMSLEFIVGIVLVYLGITNMFFKGRQTHSHNKNEATSYWKSSLLGLVHGLAGSAAMVLLTMSTVNTIWEGAIYIVIFGIGTCVGMLLFTTVLGVPFVFSTKKVNVNGLFTKVTGSISIIFGIYYMYNIGFNDGLFKIWI